MQHAGEEDISEREFLVHSKNLASDETGEMLHLFREKAKWESMSFFVRRLLLPAISITRTRMVRSPRLSSLAERARPIGEKARGTLENVRMFSTAFLMRCICPLEKKSPLRWRRFAKSQNAGFHRQRD